MASVITPNSTTGPIKKPTFPPQCKFFIPGRQAVGSGSPLDISGNGNHGILQANTVDAAFWAVSAGMSTAAGAAGVAKGFSIPAAAWDFDFSNGDSCILAFQIRRPAGLPATGLRAIGDSPAGNEQGFTLGLSTAGTLQPRLSDSGARSYVAASAHPTVVANNTWHTVAFVVHKGMNQFSIYIDTTLGAITTQCPNLITSTNGGVIGKLLSFGNADSSGGIGTLDLQFRNVHGYVYKNANLPANWYQLLKGLFDNPFLPLGASR